MVPFTNEIGLLVKLRACAAVQANSPVALRTHCVVAILLELSETDDGVGAKVKKDDPSLQSSIALISELPAFGYPARASFIQ